MYWRSSASLIGPSVKRIPEAGSGWGSGGRLVIRASISRGLWSIIVSGISGSKVSDMATVAPALFPEMKRRGHKPREMVALLATGAAMADTVPPSIVLIVLGAVAGVSIAGLFQAGFVIAMVLLAVLLVLARWKARHEDMHGAKRAPLSLVLNGNRLRGHSIECRVNAEDPTRNFQPSPGLITTYHPPGGPGVRVDTHIYAGYTVPPYYDSLLAKVIVHGNTRTEALARMRQALDSFIIEGVTTTIPFLGRVMRHPDFVAGKIDTKFLEREPQLLKEQT